MRVFKNLQKAPPPPPASFTRNFTTSHHFLLLLLYHTDSGSCACASGGNDAELQAAEAEIQAHLQAEAPQGSKASEMESRTVRGAAVECDAAA